MLKAMLIAERARNDRLRQIIKELQRHRFGRRAETLPEDQMLLGLEEVEQVAASGEAESEAANPVERAKQSAKRRMNRGSLPAHLPRIEMVVDIDDRSCPCCGNTLCIGSARIRASGSTSCRRSSAYWLWATQICLPGVRERGGAGAAPARLIEGGLPTEATVAQVLVSKYADHLPLYRQAQIRDCQDFCVRRFPSCAHEALFEHDGELRLRLGPLARRSFPIRSGVVQNQI